MTSEPSLAVSPSSENSIKFKDMKRKDLKNIIDWNNKIIDMQRTMIEINFNTIASMEIQSSVLFRTIQALIYENVTEEQKAELRSKFPRVQ